jgi:hypothetical protein
VASSGAAWPNLPDLPEHVRAVDARVDSIENVHGFRWLRFKANRQVVVNQDDRARAGLRWENGQLRGFLGLYAFGGSPVEIAGMVDPCARRCGIPWSWR